jgi:phosphoribosylaminoimidazole-succinocarboxamide synthase
MTAVEIVNGCGIEGTEEVQGLVAALMELGFETFQSSGSEPANGAVRVRVVPDSLATPVACQQVPLRGAETLLERVLRSLPLSFERLPLVVEGESKVIRRWTERIVVERFKPTIYSYTMNRYGEVEGTDTIRLKFTAALFRLLAHREFQSPYRPQSAFLAEIESPQGPLIVQRLVDTCNLETRIKRYHVGSPLHRYLYAERYESTQSAGTIRRWSRFNSPVVCFDWRHPLYDDEGRRLADEPLSDDYAGVWMYDVGHAKEMARQLFLWMEELFAKADLLLIDLCVFIDRHGRLIYGEVSPDCMRVRQGLGDPAAAESLDKDLWRSGGTPEQVRSRYQALYEKIFPAT